MKRILAHLLVAAIGFGTATTTAAQTDYPNKTVRILVGYSPGGATDLLARAVAEADAPRRAQLHRSFCHF